MSPARETRRLSSSKSAGLSARPTWKVVLKGFRHPIPWTTHQPEFQIWWRSEPAGEGMARSEDTSGVRTSSAGEERRDGVRTNSAAERSRMTLPALRDRRSRGARSGPSSERKERLRTASRGTRVTPRRFGRRQCGLLILGLALLGTLARAGCGTWPQHVREPLAALLIFGEDSGAPVAADAASSQPLWSFKTSQPHR
jgi:hypothetical protein